MLSTYLKACATLLLAGHSWADNDAAYKLRLAHGGSREHAYQIGAERLSQLVHRKTPGGVRIDIFPEGQLASESAAAEAVLLGNADIAILSTGAMSHWTPIIQLLDMPYLFRNRLHAYQILDGEIGEMLNKEMEKAGFINLAYWEIGIRHLTNNDHPVGTPDDLHGLSIRVMPSQVYISLLKAWGAKPVPLALSKLYNALEHGTVAGEENSLETIRAMRLYETQQYLSLTAHAYSFAVVVMNKRRFQKLDVATQGSLKTAAKQAALFERAYVRNKEVETLNFLRDHRMIVVRPQIELFRRAAQTVYRDMVDEVPSYWVDKITNTK